MNGNIVRIRLHDQKICCGGARLTIWGIVLPVPRVEEPMPFTIPPKEVTKVALRLKHLIEQVIPYEIDQGRVTGAHGAVLTRNVEQTAKDAAGKENKACVVFSLLVCKHWFKRQST